MERHGTDLAVNKRATFEYAIEERLQAGIELTGHETKSAKMGRIDLSGARIAVDKGSAFAIGIAIPSFQPNNAPLGYDPHRTRRLLLTRAEIKTLMGKTQNGLTIVPLKAYTVRAHVKIELGIGTWRKKEDRRELLKKRETEREIRKFRK